MDWSNKSSIGEYYLSRAGVYAIVLKDTDLCIGAIDIKLEEVNDKVTLKLNLVETLIIKLTIMIKLVI